MIERHMEELESMEKGDQHLCLTLLANNQRRMRTNEELYYDEKQDRIWIENYYGPILTDVSSLQLFDKYRELVINTHIYKLPYYLTKDQYLYTWVDLHPNGKLKTIYSGSPRNPKSFIEEDFVTIQKRFERYRQLVLTQRFSGKRLEKQVQDISDQHKFNAEHVIPQSWFGAKEPMKGDLHHLFACEPRCNSARSNFPYYEFELEQTKSAFRNKCGIYEFNRFEPQYGKGVVARATLYFLLRYPKKIAKRFRKTIDLPLLIDWHEKYNVSDYEKHRNKAIFEIQGNRNPFIDFPHLVSELSFQID